MKKGLIWLTFCGAAGIFAGCLAFYGLLAVAAQLVKRYPDGGTR